jgi:hypothetical protein
MSEVVLTLPDDLATEAKEMGLFSPTLAASLFRAELRRRKVNKFFETADRLAELGGEPMSDDEINAEIAAARAERRRS